MKLETHLSNKTKQMIKKATSYANFSKFQFNILHLVLCPVHDLHFWLNVIPYFISEFFAACSPVVLSVFIIHTFKFLLEFPFLILIRASALAQFDSINNTATL